MPQLVSQAEFDQLLEASQPDLSPYPVFVAPKKTDRGYFNRREALMRYQAAQAKLVNELQDLQRQGNKLDKRSAAIRDDLAALKAKRDAAASASADTSDLDRQIASLEADLEALDDQAAPILEKLAPLVEQVDEMVAGQVTIILPYIKAVKYPRADGTAEFWLRPAGGDDLAAFEDTARALLKDVSEEDFTTMTTAITGPAGGAGAVPTRNGSK